MKKKLNILKYFYIACLTWLSIVITACDSDDTKDKRPAAVDHSTSKYFPPIGKQEIGDCTCWSSCYYYNTYTQARDHDLDASSGDPDAICSPRFLFSLISQGHYGAECTEHAMERLSVYGCATVSQYPMDTHWEKWPGEKTRIAALRNRTGKLHKVRADTPEGLEEVKQHIANGGCAVTRGLFRENYPSYGDSAAGPGINNGVMYAKTGRNWLRHSLCICGYDDERAYIDERDGQMYKGAFLIANSEGQDWGSCNSTGTGTKGFLWVAYNMFLEGQFGLYDHDDNPYTDPCFDNPDYPTIYYHEDLPDYVPTLYAVIGINHPKRNMLQLTGGVGSNDQPNFQSSDVIEFTDSGEIPIIDTNSVVIDLSDGVDLIGSDGIEQVFIELVVHSSSVTAASITSIIVYYDPESNMNYQKIIPLNQTLRVKPGEKGYLSVDLIDN